MSFVIWSSDITGAYLRSMEPMNRQLFIKQPTVKFELNNDEFLEFLKPWHAWSDSGSSWYAAPTKYLCNDIALVPKKMKSSLSLRHDDNSEHIWLNASDVDDLLRAGTPSFYAYC